MAKVKKAPQRKPEPEVFETLEEAFVTWLERGQGRRVFQIGMRPILAATRLQALKAYDEREDIVRVWDNKSLYAEVAKRQVERAKEKQEEGATDVE